MKRQFNLKKKMRSSMIVGEDRAVTFYESDLIKFLKILKEACEQEDYDVMIEDGEDGEISISFSEFIDRRSGYSSKENVK